LSEIALLAKPAILIPIPDSHQEDNANFFKNSSIILEQKELNAKLFVEKIKQLFENKEELNRISREVKKMIKPGAAEFLAEKIYEYSRPQN
jgi:UDP-N-acetylglucosamine:LPS N-acetylglucosamine transferase